MDPVDTPVPGTRLEPRTSHVVRDLSGAGSEVSKVSVAAPEMSAAVPGAGPPVPEVSDAFPEVVADLGAPDAAAGAASAMSGAVPEVSSAAPGVSGAVQGLPALPTALDDDVVRQLIARGQAIVFLPGPPVEQAISRAQVP